MKRDGPFHQHALVLGNRGQALARVGRVDQVHPDLGADVGFGRLNGDRAVLKQHAGGDVSRSELLHRKVGVPRTEANGILVGGRKGLVNGEGGPCMLTAQDIDSRRVGGGEGHVDVGQ